MSNDLTEREFRPVNTALFRMWIWRLNISAWKVSVWREAEGEQRLKGNIVGRVGPPWRYCVRICLGYWHVHLGFGRYRVVYPQYVGKPKGEDS